MALKEKLPERYHDMIAMYAKGHANSLDLLRTDFGHWPPNGLDIVRAPDIDVQFKSVFSTAYGLKSVAPGILETAWFLNLLTKNSVTAFAYLGVMTALKSLSLGGFVDPSKPETIHLNDGYRLFGGWQSGRRFLSHIIAHEFKHVVQARDSSDSLSSSFDDRTGIEHMMEGKPKKHLRYLANECEMQARLHTVVVGGYHQFEKMPLTRGELFAFLASQKVNVPERIMSEIKNSPYGAKRLIDFAPNEYLYKRYADKSAVKDINSVIDALDPAYADQFWDDAIPFIYGDLLELYGDREGHKRMGHCHNIQLREVFYKSAAEMYGLEMSLTHNTDLDIAAVEEAQQDVRCMIERLSETLKMMPKDDALELAGMLLRDETYDAHGASVSISFNRDKVGQAAVRAIYNRDDMSKTDQQSLTRTYHKIQRDQGADLLRNLFSHTKRRNYLL
tara:strand:+ start:528 stop:1865 length:1338 start_codon:yes stop_codon:yes gene_type:complete